MKIYALLLSLVVLFLSVKSVVEPAALLKEVDACCKEKVVCHDAAENQKDEHNCCNDLCSPFQPCCPYVAFSTMITTAIEQSKFSPLGEKCFSLYNVSFVSKYTSDFWQPPKSI